MQSFDNSLQALCNETNDPIIKSYLITAQQSIGLDRKLEFLQRTYESSSHPVVRYRCIQQLCFTPDGSFMKGIARQYLRDSSLHIRLNVMDWLASTADSNDATYFRKGLEAEGNELLLVKLFKGWLKATGGSREAAQALLANADRFENLQARADLFALLGPYSDRYAELQLQAAYHTEYPVVGYRIVEGIRAYYKKNPVPDSVRQTIAAHSIFLIKSGKDPLNTFGADLLADTNIQAFSIMERTKWLEDLIKEETNPRVEYALMRALRSMKGAPPPGRAYFLAEHAKPDWDAIAQIPRGAKVDVHTSKGTFTVDLFLENAPMSVWRFYELCKSGYYDSTVVHRVVFPHVVQGGSQFGDGHNDDLHPIRTETTLRHFDEPGLVGFASDGRDTETGQFFITHVPRPHLDENFTILGKVTAGMDVVNGIHKGDVVLKTEITDE
jgi:cyclophilin family peptidyl-prolyl cis-trans isomerase